MLYKITDINYHGSYIDLDCIQSINPEYGEYSEPIKGWPEDVPLPTEQGTEILIYTITLTSGQQFCLEIEDYKTLAKVLIEEGLMMPDPQESEGVLSNDPWQNNGQQGPKDPHKKESEEA